MIGTSKIQQKSWYMDDVLIEFNLRTIYIPVTLNRVVQYLLDGGGPDFVQICRCTCCTAEGTQICAPISHAKWDEV